MFALISFIKVTVENENNLSNFLCILACVCIYILFLFVRADPHPGNMIFLNEPRGQARIALIDFGLVASVRQEDMDTMVSALIHLANRDYPSLVDDFISLNILPADCDREKVVPLMDKALTPYVKVTYPASTNYH